MNIPIVSLDKIYINIDNINTFFLDCTRINGVDKTVSRKGENIELQIKELAKKIKSKQIILADDVVFSGTVMNKEFKKEGVEVVLIISSICTNKAYNDFNSKLKYGLKTNYLMLDDVIDQVCERDFYFGIAGSGILVEKGKELLKAPYFKPYGNPNERASIPTKYENDFSIGCIERSIYLWEEIDRLKRYKTKIGELPENIVNTYKEDGIVKTLKRELKRL